MKYHQNKLPLPELLKETSVNYRLLSPLLTDNNQAVEIDLSNITLQQIEELLTEIYNLHLDAIETEWLCNTALYFKFADGPEIYLDLCFSYLNLSLWSMMVQVGQPILSKNLFFIPPIEYMREDGTIVPAKYITAGSIKKWIDKNFLQANPSVPSKLINNAIDDALMFLIKLVDEESDFLMNTLNLEDFIELAEANPEFNALLHQDFSDVELENMQTEGMKFANKMLQLIANSDKYMKNGKLHCLADAVRSEQGINPRQFKEVFGIIGTKPDGEGSIHPLFINHSFVNGGMKSIGEIFIEGNASRQAQIINKENVGDSGHLARILGLNNQNTKLNDDPNFDCHSPNFQLITIKSKAMLKLFDGRYYRLQPNGLEFLLTEDDDHMIGKTIYLRSPMTCASAAAGEGICYKCFGMLAHRISEINVGKNAAENESRDITQLMLSAKHNLAVEIQKLHWSETSFEWFDLELNFFRITRETKKNQFLVINVDDISLDSDEDDINDLVKEDYMEFVTSVYIQDGSRTYEITTDEKTELYLSSELNTIIKRHNNKTAFVEDEDGTKKIVIALDFIKDIPLFYFKIQNNELSRPLKRFNNLLNKKDVIKTMDRHQLLQELVETSLEAKINVQSIHAEIILMNQIKDPENILQTVDWYKEDAPYTILTLHQALMTNVSPFISLEYQKIPKQLHSPLLTKKHGTSNIDAAFMERPQLGPAQFPILKADNGLMAFDAKTEPYLA